MQLRVWFAQARVGVPGAVGRLDLLQRIRPCRGAIAAADARAQYDPPHQPHACRGIGPAERCLEQLGVLYGLDRLLPGHHIGKIGPAVGRRGAIGGRLLEPVDLLRVALAETFEAKTAEIERAGGDVEIEIAVRVDARIGDGESGVRAARRPDDVEDGEPRLLGVESRAFVIVVVGRDASLLQADAVVALRKGGGVARNVFGRHGMPQVSKMNAGISPNGMYSVTFAVTPSSMMGELSELNAPISEPLSAPRRMPCGAASLIWQ